MSPINPDNGFIDMLNNMSEVGINNANSKKTQHKYITPEFKVGYEKASIAAITGKIEDLINSEGISSHNKCRLLDRYRMVVKQAGRKIYWWDRFLVKIFPTWNPKLTEKINEITAADEFILSKIDSIEKEFNYYDRREYDRDYQYYTIDDSGNGRGKLMVHSHDEWRGLFFVYEGELKNGKPHGKGMLRIHRNPNTSCGILEGVSFEGEFNEGYLTELNSVKDNFIKDMRIRGEEVPPMYTYTVGLPYLKINGKMYYKVKYKPNPEKDWIIDEILTEDGQVLISGEENVKKVYKENLVQTGHAISDSNSNE